MDYKKHYDLLIEKYGYKIRPENGYYEHHHIVPKCIGGDNSEENLIWLSYRAHYLAHYLLTKIHKDPGIFRAFALMCYYNRASIRIPSRVTSKLRELISGVNHPRSKRVMTPKGEFGSAREAARALKVSIATITKKASSNKIMHKGYYYIDNPVIGSAPTNHGQHLSRAVVTPLGLFRSVRDAGRAHNVNHSTINKRVNRGDPGYFYP